MLLMLAWLLGDANSSPGGMKVTKTLQEVPAGTVSVFETFLEKHGGFIGAPCRHLTMRQVFSGL